MEQQKTILFDLAKLKNACIGSDELVIKLLRLFLSQAPQWSTKLQLAVADEDYKAVAFVSHTIKGGSATLYAKDVIASAVELNEFVTSEGALSGSELRQLADRVNKALSDTALEIENYLNVHSTMGVDL